MLIINVIMRNLILKKFLEGRNLMILGVIAMMKNLILKEFLEMVRDFIILVVTTMTITMKNLIGCVFIVSKSPQSLSFYRQIRSGCLENL